MPLCQHAHRGATQGGCALYALSYVKVQELVRPDCYRDLEKFKPKTFYANVIE